MRKEDKYLANLKAELAKKLALRIIPKLAELEIFEFEGYNFSGIQQIGIGVANMPEAWKWYRKYFGVDIRIFEEAAVAANMVYYTGNEVRSRHATLALNIQGGGGFEIWQYTDRIPQPPKNPILPGDLGIFAAKIKCHDLIKTYNFYKSENLKLTSICADYLGNKSFFVQDPYGNQFQIAEATDWFINDKKLTGGVKGAIIGVSDMKESLFYYSFLLDFDTIMYDTTGSFADLDELSNSKNTYRRVLLVNRTKLKGPFSPIFGENAIELIQVLDRKPNKIFEDRYWGDLGFIHLCFDLNGIDNFETKCAIHEHPYTVKTGDSFDMGEAAGRFAYNEDPDGTLIEFVETHKVPILKKFGWFLNLTNRDPEKSLPRWILKCMRFNRVRN